MSVKETTTTVTRRQSVQTLQAPTSATVPLDIPAMVCCAQVTNTVYITRELKRGSSKLVVFTFSHRSSKT